MFLRAKYWCGGVKQDNETQVVSERTVLENPRCYW